MKIKVKVILKSAKENIENCGGVGYVTMVVGDNATARQTFEISIDDDIFINRYKNASEEDVVNEIMDEEVLKLIDWDYEIIEERKE